MSRPRALLRRQSLGIRITLTYLAVAAGVAIALSVGTFIAVRTILDNQRVTSATGQTVLGLLFAREFVGDEPERLQRVVALLEAREGLEAMVTEGDTWFSSAIPLTPDVVPSELGELVAQEKLGYQFRTIEGARTLVFGAPLPPEGVDLYLFYSLADIDETLSLLARVLLVVSVGGVVAASLLARRVSRRILLPLGAVSSAAQRVAEGLLETRVDAPSEDELGVLAASFNEMASALQEMIVRERRFVANVSHELRTPLATLEATSGLIAAHREELSAAGREAVDLIVEDVSGLRRLVEELLEVSELDAGRAKVVWEEIELLALVEAAVRRRRHEIPVEGEPVATYADKARLDRVLGNLVDNAFEHGRGEDVHVRVDGDERWCSVVVADRGPGIAEADLPRVFERFFKTDASRSREQGGVGLGLALALENARLMGGTIDVESGPEVGATFTLRLPLRSEPPPEDGS